MWRGIKRYEDIPAEEIADIALEGDEFPPGTYMSFTPTFKYLGTVISWDLREVKDIEARIKAANKLFGSAKATFWSNSRVPFALRMRFYKAIMVNVLLWGCESWAIQSKEVQALRVFQFRCLRSILKINVMHKISRAKILEMCQVQDIIQTMDLRRVRWVEKLSYMDFTRCPRLLFGCWLYGRVYFTTCYVAGTLTARRSSLQRFLLHFSFAMLYLSHVQYLSQGEKPNKWYRHKSDKASRCSIKASRLSLGHERDQVFVHHKAVRRRKDVAVYPIHDTSELGD